MRVFDQREGERQPVRRIREADRPIAIRLEGRDDGRLVALAVGVAAVAVIRSIARPACPPGAPVGDDQNTAVGRDERVLAGACDVRDHRARQRLGPAIAALPHAEFREVDAHDSRIQESRSQGLCQCVNLGRLRHALIMSSDHAAGTNSL